MHQVAYWRDDKELLRKIASVNYTTLAVNRDPKKSFPTINKMYPELFDDENSDIENDPLIKAARQRRLKQDGR